MDAKTKAKYQKYLDDRVFTESALESAFDNGVLVGRNKGLEEGIEKGIEKGVHIGKLELIEKGVLEAAQLGLAPADIAKVFGILEQEVLALLAQNKSGA